MRYFIVFFVLQIIVVAADTASKTQNDNIAISFRQNFYEVNLYDEQIYMSIPYSGIARVRISSVSKINWKDVEGWFDYEFFDPNGNKLSLDFCLAPYSMKNIFGKYKYEYMLFAKESIKLTGKCKLVIKLKAVTPDSIKIKGNTLLLNVSPIHVIYFEYFKLIALAEANNTKRAKSILNSFFDFSQPDVTNNEGAKFNAALLYFYINAKEESISEAVKNFNKLVESPWGKEIRDCCVAFSPFKKAINSPIYKNDNTKLTFDKWAAIMLLKKKLFQKKLNEAENK